MTQVWGAAFTQIGAHSPQDHQAAEEAHGVMLGPKELTPLAKSPSYLEVEYSSITGSKALVLGDDSSQSFLIQRQGRNGS